MLKRMCLIAAAVGSIAAATPVASAGAGPVRSGSVLGGPIDTGPGTSCEIAAECAAWLATGCSPHMAGIDPAVQTSIVDVSDLAGRRTIRRFVVSPGSVAGESAGVIIGGFVIQFWSSDCVEIRPQPPVRDWSARSYRAPYYWYIRNGSRFKIPAGAAWMTAAADDNVHIRWELF